MAARKSPAKPKTKPRAKAKSAPAKPVTAAKAARPRPPRRTLGAVEKAVARDVAEIRKRDAALAGSSLAATALALAREVDGGSNLSHVEVDVRQRAPGHHGSPAGTRAGAGDR